MWHTKSWHLKKLEEKHRLPMGKKEFEEWSLRIIQVAKIPGATIKSQQFALANEITHLSAGSSYECDGFFIKRLQKHAINQVAIDIAKEIREEEKKRLSLENENQTMAHHPV